MIAQRFKLPDTKPQFERDDVIAADGRVPLQEPPQQRLPPDPQAHKVSKYQPHGILNLQRTGRISKRPHIRYNNNIQENNVHGQTRNNLLLYKKKSSKNCKHHALSPMGSNAPRKFSRVHGIKGARMKYDYNNAPPNPIKDTQKIVPKQFQSLLNVHFTDDFNDTWQIKKYVGSGGFGCIFTCERINLSCSDDKIQEILSNRVMKIERLVDNQVSCGILQEIKVYTFLNKEQHMKAFLKKNRLTYLGVPEIISHGILQSYAGVKYNFIILDQFIVSLRDYINNSCEPLHPVRAFKVALGISCVLQYLHSHKYVHRDIKPSNIMFTDIKKPFLIDYGLAINYDLNKPMKNVKNPLFTGTLKYASVDAHCEIDHPRSDYESLLYNILDWTGAVLPWTTSSVISEVKNIKQKHKQDRYCSLLETVMLKKQITWYTGIVRVQFNTFIDYLCNVEYSEELNYRFIHKIFLSIISALESVNADDTNTHMSVDT